MTEKPIACCPRCEAPLVSTMVFPAAEWYCLDCGGMWPLFSAELVTATPDLEERALQFVAEWKEHVGRRYLSNAWHHDCDRCQFGGELHPAHATAEERAAHEEVKAWLTSRIRHLPAPARTA